MLTKGLMIQGTTSDAGKSITVAGLCRLLKRRGIAVAPFKPQNMALNSAVTASGGEIGRAQALQAVACGLEAQIDFNPVLLKPSSDQKSQVILHGEAVSELDAAKFGNIKQLAFDAVLESYRRLQDQYDVVVIEGAGSPAEVNLRTHDIANMGFAEAVDCPVVLISDIDRGGVFAHLVGTLELLSASEQARTHGFIINKFRGDISLLNSGLDWLKQRTQKQMFGVLPYLDALKLDAEDAINVETHDQLGEITVKIPVLKRISNHTDFDPLRWHSNVNLQFVPAGEPLSNADLIILPGSKSVRNDIQHLREQGWDCDIKRHLRYGGKILGICGGFQMLGQSVNDPYGIESSAGETQALKLLNFSTQLRRNKQLTQVEGTFKLGDQQSTIRGYEIHCGVSEGPALSQYFSTVTDQSGEQYVDGVISDDGQIIGTYLHGLFEHPDALATILSWVAEEQQTGIDWEQIRNSELDRLADCLEQHLDIDALLQL